MKYGKKKQWQRKSALLPLNTIEINELYINTMVAYFCHHLSDNYVDLSDLYVVLSNLYVVLSDLYVDLLLIHLLENNS